MAGKRREPDAPPLTRREIAHNAAAVSAERRRWVPSAEQRQQAITMCAVGVTREQIAQFFGVDREALRRELGDELDRAEVQAVAKVAQTLYRRATEGNDLGAAIFYLKARGGWRETPAAEVNLAQGIAIHVHL